MFWGAIAAIAAAGCASEECAPFDGTYEFTIQPHGDDPCLGSESGSAVIAIAPGDLNTPAEGCTGSRSFSGCRLEIDQECPVREPNGNVTGYTRLTGVITQEDGPAYATGTGSVVFLLPDRSIDCRTGVLDFIYERL